MEEGPLYNLSIAGFDSELSTVQDSLTAHNSMAFTTSDNDNDQWDDGNCAEAVGGWWFTACHASNLNGFNFNNASLPAENRAQGIIWRNAENVPDQFDYFSWPQALMQIRRSTSFKKFE